MPRIACLSQSQNNSNNQPISATISYNGSHWMSTTTTNSNNNNSKQQKQQQNVKIPTQKSTPSSENDKKKSIPPSTLDRVFHAIKLQDTKDVDQWGWKRDVIPVSTNQSATKRQPTASTDKMTPSHSSTLNKSSSFKTSNHHLFKRRYSDGDDGRRRESRASSFSIATWDVSPLLDPWTFSSNSRVLETGHKPYLHKFLTQWQAQNPQHSKSMLLKLWRGQQTLLNALTLSVSKQRPPRHRQQPRSDVIRNDDDKDQTKTHLTDSTFYHSRPRRRNLHALQGHGVPKELLQNHLDLGNQLLNCLTHYPQQQQQEPSNFARIPTSTTESCSFHNHQGHLSFQWVRAKYRDGTQRAASWTHAAEHVADANHSMDLYLTVMKRLVTHLGVVLLLTDPARPNDENKTTETKQEQAWPTGKQQVPLHSWSVDIVRGLAVPPNLIPKPSSTTSTLLLTSSTTAEKTIKERDTSNSPPILVEWIPKQQHSSLGHVIVRLQGVAGTSIDDHDNDNNDEANEVDDDIVAQTNDPEQRGRRRRRRRRDMQHPQQHQDVANQQKSVTLLFDACFRY